MTELFYKMQFVKNVVVYVFGVFTFSFCYGFYEGFIHKTILVSWFLPSICISYPLKVFKSDTGILHDSCAVPLLEILTFSCLIYWTATEVLMNLVAPLDSAMPALEFEWFNVFWTSGFDSVSIVFDSFSISRSLPELYFSHSI